MYKPRPEVIPLSKKFVLHQTESAEPQVLSNKNSPAPSVKHKFTPPQKYINPVANIKIISNKLSRNTSDISGLLVYNHNKSCKTNSNNKNNKMKLNNQHGPCHGAGSSSKISNCDRLLRNKSEIFAHNFGKKRDLKSKPETAHLGHNYACRSNSGPTIRREQQKSVEIKIIRQNANAPKKKLAATNSFPTNLSNVMNNMSQMYKTKMKRFAAKSTSSLSKSLDHELKLHVQAETHDHETNCRVQDAENRKHMSKRTDLNVSTTNLPRKNSKTKKTVSRSKSLSRKIKERRNKAKLAINLSLDPEKIDLVGESQTSGVYQNLASPSVVPNSAKSLDLEKKFETLPAKFFSDKKNAILARPGSPDIRQPDGIQRTTTFYEPNFQPVTPRCVRLSRFSVDKTKRAVSPQNSLLGTKSIESQPQTVTTTSKPALFRTNKSSSSFCKKPDFSQIYDPQIQKSHQKHQVQLVSFKQAKNFETSQPGPIVLQNVEVEYQKKPTQEESVYENLMSNQTEDVCNFTHDFGHLSFN